MRGLKNAIAQPSSSGKNKIVNTLLICLVAIWPISCGAFSPKPISASEQLTSLILAEQTRNVKRSTGVYAYNCFTKDDLRAFHHSGQVGRIVKEVRTTQRFKDIVATVSRLSKDEQAQLLGRARKTARPTYAMTGYIDASGNSQTEAGRVAELELAAGICDAVKDAIVAMR